MWYYPNDPVKFKWWVCNAKWGGHPWETRFGNFEPYPVKNTHYFSRNICIKTKADISHYFSDNWLLLFSTAHRCTPFALRSFIHLRELGLPVIWIHGDMDVRYLTKRYTVDQSKEPDWLSLDNNEITGGI